VRAGCFAPKTSLSMTIQRKFVKKIFHSMNHAAERFKKLNRRLTPIKKGFTAHTLSHLLRVSPRLLRVSPCYLLQDYYDYRLT
jgi:hypothetical protein